MRIIARGGLRGRGIDAETQRHRGRTATVLVGRGLGGCAPGIEGRASLANYGQAKDGGENVSRRVTLKHFPASMFYARP